jgi:hypothetical protein
MSLAPGTHIGSYEIVSPLGGSRRTTASYDVTPDRRFVIVTVDGATKVRITVVVTGGLCSRVAPDAIEGRGQSALTP